MWSHVDCGLSMCEASPASSKSALSARSSMFSHLAHFGGVSSHWIRIWSAVAVSFWMILLSKIDLGCNTG